MTHIQKLVVPALMLAVLIGVASGAGEPAGPSDSQEAQKAGRAAIAPYNPGELVLYREQQRQLQVALKAYFDRALVSGDIVGAGVSIVKGDSILLSEGYGKRKSGEPGEVDGRTLFRLGSLSKGFAGILAANLVSEGVLSWEDRVSDFVPEFRFGDQQYTRQINLSHLLSHTSGAPYHSYTNLVEAGLPLRDIAGRFGEVPPISAPGEVYSYQNALFALSGEMMFSATGKTIDDLLAERFFNPLGMCATSMDHESVQRAVNVAYPHYKRRNGWRPGRLSDKYYNAIAAGGINASALDMASWMQMVLGHRPEVMSPAAIRQVFQPYVEIPGRSKYYQRWPGHIASHYGFGWRIHTFKTKDTDREQKIWHHGGSVNSYRNEIALFPETDIGICVLLNSNSRLSGTVIPDLYEIVQAVIRKAETNLALNY